MPAPAPAVTSEQIVRVPGSAAALDRCKAMRSMRMLAAGSIMLAARVDRFKLRPCERQATLGCKTYLNYLKCLVSGQLSLSR